MKKYRIEEQKYEDGRSVFLAQYSDLDLGGQPQWEDFTHWLHGKYLMSKKVETYEEALFIIDNDKQKSMIPIETVFHDV